MGYRHSSEVQIINGITFYPDEYFSPFYGKDVKLILSENTYGIHLGARSWEGSRFGIIKYLRLNIIGPEWTSIFRRILRSVKFK